MSSRPVAPRRPAEADGEAGPHLGPTHMSSRPVAPRRPAEADGEAGAFRRSHLIQVQVEQLDVEDPAELLAAASLSPERPEAGRLVDGGAGRVRLGDPGEQYGDLGDRASTGDEVGQQRPADAGAAARGIDVDGDLAGSPVGAARGPGPDRGPADDLAVAVGGDRDRVVGGARGQPAVVAAGLAGIDVEGRDAGFDLTVVDREDPWQVAEPGGSDVDLGRSDPSRLDKPRRRPKCGSVRSLRERSAERRPYLRTDRHPRLYFCIRANHKTGGLIDRQPRAEDFDPDFRWQRIPGERPGREPAVVGSH